MIELICSIFVSLSIILSIGDYYYVVPMIGLMFLIMYKLSMPFVKLDIRLHQFLTGDAAKWRSFMHESIRGSAIIRAFN